jgi:hypothetical protein
MSDPQASVDAAEEQAISPHRSRRAVAASERSCARVPHAAGFQTLTGGLIGLAVAAIVVAVVIAAGGRSGAAGSSTPWSA